MTPRPRKVSDDDVFAATHRAMTRLGPGELTLADIAEEAGVTAGALVQRFGSRRELLLSLTRRFAEGGGGFIAALRAKHRSPLAAIRDYAECMSHLAESPAAFARNLAYLQIDLTDPDFRKLLAVQGRASRQAMEELIAEAISAGELKPETDPATLARLIEAMLHGSMMSWGFYREGTARKWMKRDVDALLLPYLA
jgi:AcrR family transcriptional regulator